MGQAVDWEKVFTGLIDGTSVDLSEFHAPALRIVAIPGRGRGLVGQSSLFASGAEESTFFIYVGN